MTSFKKYLLIIYTIINLSLFSYTKIENYQFINFIKLINFIPVVIYFSHIIFTERRRTGYFSLPVSIFILSLILGSISAFIYYHQSFIQSFTVSSIFFPFFTYLMLVQLDLKKDDILQIVKLIFWVTLFIFSLDFYTFPDTLFATRSEEIETRKSLGIIFDGLGFTILGALFYLQRYLITNKIYNLIPFIIASVFIIFLTGSRTYLFALIASSLFVIIYDLLNVNSKKNKAYTILSLFGIFSIAIYYLQTHLLNLVDITKDQFSNYSDDIRLESINYYTTTFQKGFFTQLCGNGFPHSESELGLIRANAHESGYFESDIGIIGLWSYFGLLSVIAWIFIYIRVFNKKYIRQNIVVVAFFIYIFINSFLTFTIFDPGYMLAYIYALYLFNTRHINKKVSPSVKVLNA